MRDQENPVRHESVQHGLPPLPTRLAWERPRVHRLAATSAEIGPNPFFVDKFKAS